MDLQREGKRAVISGSTAGIGFAIAEALAREGASVVLNGRTEARVNDAVATLQNGANRGSVSGVTADLGTARGVAHFIERVSDTDILVNNVGIFEPVPFEQIHDADWFRFFEVNVMSGVRLCRQYLPLMKARGWGRVVFISSESAVQIPAEMIHYGLTKTAELALSRGLAETTIGTDVTVNAVLPGPTASEGVTAFIDRLATDQKMSREAFEEEFFRTMRPTSLLKRFERPEEIAALVAFLCSPLASATNGAAVRADGGVVRAVI